jgi:general secretion pathway protein G
MSTPSSNFHPSAERGSVKFWIIVVIVVGLVSGLRVRSIGPQPELKAKYESTRNFLRTDMARAFITYRQHMGELPSTKEGLIALLQAPSGEKPKWHGPYLATPNGQLPLDPWGDPYDYRQPGIHNKDSYDLFSKGPDATADTVDDIGNW